MPFSPRPRHSVNRSRRLPSANSMAISSREPKALAVPMILCYGAREKTGRFKVVHTHITQVFGALRPKGALWSVAVDPLTEHNCGKSRAQAVDHLRGANFALGERFQRNEELEARCVHPGGDVLDRGVRLYDRRCALLQFRYSSK